jgi:4-hydroxyphenylpyruvate dioxygenase-like putative hemolysin
MIAAEMQRGGVRFVLCQGTEPGSQVSQLIAGVGAGVADIALQVEDVHQTVAGLANEALHSIPILLRARDLFSRFPPVMPIRAFALNLLPAMVKDGFQEGNVQQLFEQLERSGRY